MILVIFVIAIMVAFYMQKKIQLRREAEHERRQERFERLMYTLRKPNNDTNDAPDSYRESDTTKDEEKSQS